MKVLLAFFTLLVMCQCFGQVNLSNGLVAHYTFDGNADDVSGNSHHGQLINGTRFTADRFGKSNSAALFDGIDDYIRIKDNGAFSTPTFSIVVWFKTESDEFQDLISKRDFSTYGGTGGAQYQFIINYRPYPGITSNIVGNNSTCNSIPYSSYINTNEWICRNKWYMGVVTFDGQRHKIYIDGVLKRDEVTGFTAFLNCTSDIRFGNWWQGDLTPYKGIMDDIRWYNRALNEQEIQALYAGYPTLVGACSPGPGIGFLAPDTVCVNTPVSIANTSVGASTFYWNFCVANSSTNPVGTNLGNFGFSKSVYIDYAKDGDNYYGFVTNNMPGKLVRLDFGNSLLNTPTVHDFGNLGGIIPDYCEGIQVVQNEGRWYALVVGDQPVGRIVVVDFGPSLSNNSPAATNWGDVGGLAYPTDLHLFKSGNEWYGLTINAQTNSITRFSFTSSFKNKPSGVNLGNIGGLNYPTGIYAIAKDNNWYAFVTNMGGTTSGLATSSLTRLDFGSSLVNVPTGVNLGNPGNALRSARDLTIYQSCNEIFGYVVNYSANNDIVRLNFNNSLTSTPLATSIGNTGSLSFPHCISRLFRVGNDLYSFIANVDNNTITRLKFEGCNGASSASSTEQNPPAVTYSQPGIYNINLTIDDGLPTQASICKQVVVLSSVHTPLQQKSVCAGDSVRLTSSAGSGNEWSNGSTSTSIFAKAGGIYWVKSTNASGCVNIDSFSVSVQPVPVVNLGKDTSFCTNDSLVLNAGNSGASYLWQNGQTSQVLVARQPGSYYVTVTKNGCRARDTILLYSLPLPVVTITGKTSICKGGATTLSATGGVSYAWSPALGLSSPLSANTTASPAVTTQYLVKASDLNGCTGTSSVTVTITPKPAFAVQSSKAVLCIGDTAVLKASGGDVYTWSPANSLSNATGDVTFAYPQTGTRYKVIIENYDCKLRDSLYLMLPVAEKPLVKTTKSNDINCILGQATLRAGGGHQYLWQPITGLSDPTSSSPLVSINATTTYHVFVTTVDGCTLEDSITVNVDRTDDGTGFPVPTAFTPNGDGKNDCFGVKYWGDVSEFSMRLFNRWGEMLFQADKPTQCWNGNFKGQQQPPGVYVYIIRAKTRCGDVFRKGTFTLIR